MKRLFLFALLVLAGIAEMHAQIPHISIRQFQEAPFDSLLLADVLQNSVPSRWTLQRSPAPYYLDTVTITAVCAVPAKVLTFTAGGFTMLLYDTGAVSNWGSVFVRVNAPTDTAQIILDGFLNVERGDIIEITGLVSEFPLTSMNSLTQFQPIAGRPINIIGSAPAPGYTPMSVGDFQQGVFPGGPVKYSTGEPREGWMVEFTDLTVDARVNTARGTFSAVDAFGNQITMYDASRFFTLGHGGTTPFPADTLWTLQYPVVGSRLDTLRGFITTVSGGENPRGYRIAPIFRGDVVVGVILPSVTTHRRNPIVVPPDSAARISVRATQQAGGNPIAAVELNYSLNNGPFVNVAMTFQASDTTYNAQIPQQTANTFVHYFMQAIDNQGNRATLASSAFGGAASDTSKGYFFYTVLDRQLTVHDIQFTPYVNGRSAYQAAFVDVSGVVTADTGHIGLSPLNTGGTSAWYMQNGTQPWNGLWIVGPEGTMAGLRNGDSVTVSGFVSEQFDVTRIQNITTVVVHSTSNPQPSPVVVPTSTFGPIVGNGTPSAERYEGMLVRFNNVTVSSIDPVFSDPTEFEVDDGSGPVIVRRDGRHIYSNVPADSTFGKTILRVGNNISSLTGVIYFSFNRYKIVPRKNADFGTITTSVEIDYDPIVPQSYALEQNYPNPFNPATVIEYNLPTSEIVTLKIFNMLGQEVQTLVSGAQEPGRYTVRFDGAGLSSGMYFYRLQSGEFTQIKKMLLLK
ncbi:MAG: T9SS type A sorting domain-containing protein [Bacteroidota bacterium]